MNELDKININRLENVIKGIVRVAFKKGLSEIEKTIKETIDPEILDEVKKIFNGNNNKVDKPQSKS